MTLLMVACGGPILTIYTSYDVFLRKELPFRGRNDCTCVKRVNFTALVKSLCWNNLSLHIEGYQDDSQMTTNTILMRYLQILPM